MKISELYGAELDYWVAVIMGKKRPLTDTSAPNGPDVCLIDAGREGWITYAPSTDWEQLGPVIENEQISLEMVEPGRWLARVRPERSQANDNLVRCSGTGAGETPLIAACRALVASRYVYEVPA